MNKLHLIIILILLACAACKSKKNKIDMDAPKAKMVEYRDTTHGDVRVDQYYWLREKENSEVIDYLKAENTYTKELTKHTEKLREELYEEMVARIQETDLSVPVKDGDYYYYTRTEEGKNYRIYCRKKGNLDATEEVLLDGNQLAEGKEYFSLRSFEVSDDHKLLAYAMDDDGSEQYDIYVKNLETGKMLNDQIKTTGGTVIWANDNETFFYTKLDPARRPYQLHRHKLGTTKDEMVFEEKDESFFLGATKTKSKQYIFISLGSQVTNEYRYLDANNPTGKFKVFAERQQNEEYSVTHHGDDFYITTNDNALNFKVMKTSVGQTDRKYWKEFIPHSEKVLISSVEAFKNHLVVYGREGGFKNISIINLENNKKHEVQFPEPVYTYRNSENPDFNTNLVRFTYTSPITPNTVYDYDMNSKKFILKKEYEVLGGYDKSNYITERTFATAKDGTKVPISIAYKKGLKKNGKNPCYLQGYGSYGYSYDPAFASTRISLMDRGFVYALAHIRGGSEMGRQWYEDGKYLKKKNTFTDFIACAEHVISEKYTTKERLAIQGGSAGGLLMGAVTNMRPDLFAAVVADVPFVDVINTMMDETIPLTVIEYEEWGNPNNKEYYDYMKSYSPYDNVEVKNYPHMLVTAGLNDPRVQYWEPAKWTAKLREMKTNDNTLILKTNMDAGHGGASGRYERLKEIAFDYAFVIDKVGENIKN